MRKSLLLFAMVSLFAANAFAASYWVVMKDGSQYECKQKWTVKDGKAWFTTVAGQTLTVDPAQIDVAKSEQATKYNGGAVIAGAATAPTTTAAAQEGLGSQIKLRKPASQVAPAAAPPPAPAPTTPTTTGSTAPAVPPPIPQGGGELSAEVLQKFERAFENVGIFEHKVVSTSAHSIRAEVTADSEEKVFNAISATAFLEVRDGGVPGVHLDMVELFMKTTTGGSAGRFQMTRDDAQAIDSKQMDKSDYFVRKVIY